MDITGGVSSQPVVPQGSSGPEAKGAQADIPTAVRSDSAPVVAQSAVEQTKDPEAARLDRVRNGAQLMKSTMNNSAETFAIYRGGNGELVTRFTDRSSGRVRYFPEQSVVQFTEAISRQKEAIVDTQA